MHITVVVCVMWCELMHVIRIIVLPYAFLCNWCIQVTGTCPPQNYRVQQYVEWSHTQANIQHHQCFLEPITQSTLNFPAADAVVVRCAAVAVRVGCMSA